MKRILTLAAILLVATATATAGAATPKLGGFVNDQFKIGVTLTCKHVSSLKAGKYILVVAESTSSHNFHLTGPGVNKSTSVGGEGTFKWTLTLKKGTYKSVCDPHSSFMKG